MTVGGYVGLTLVFVVSVSLAVAFVCPAVSGACVGVVGTLGRRWIALEERWNDAERR
jgi:hypothetical protein